MWRITIINYGRIAARPPNRQGTDKENPRILMKSSRLLLIIYFINVLFLNQASINNNNR